MQICVNEIIIIIVVVVTTTTITLFAYFLALICDRL
jgi:hypothetical protein